MSEKKNNLEDKKIFLLQIIDSFVLECEKKKSACVKIFNEDLIRYYISYAKTHIICNLQTKQLMDLRNWITECDSEAKMLELLDGGISFMKKSLLNFKKIQTSNEFHNLIEEYRYEMYSELIVKYELWMVNVTRL